jgi:hypothetical protein
MSKRIRGKGQLRVHRNMFGYRGVEWNQRSAKFRARIEPHKETRGRWLGFFDTAEEAARAYDDAAREIYGDEAYLNFPNAGEKKAIVSKRKDGLCPKGHDLAVDGYKFKDVILCRKCNSEATNRYYHRQRAARRGPSEAEYAEFAERFGTDRAEALRAAVLALTTGERQK